MGHDGVREVIDEAVLAREVERLRLDRVAPTGRTVLVWLQQQQLCHDMLREFVTCVRLMDAPDAELCAPDRWARIKINERAVAEWERYTIERVADASLECWRQGLSQVEAKAVVAEQFAGLIPERLRTKANAVFKLQYRIAPRYGDKLGL